MTAAIDTVVPTPGDDTSADVVAATERALIAAVLFAPQAMDRLMTELEVAHFRDPIHQAIYARLVDLHGHGRPVDAMAFAQAVTVDATLSAHEKRAILDHLPSVISDETGLGAAELGHNINYVRHAAARRLMARIGVRLHQIAPTADPEDLSAALDHARDVFTAALTPSTSSRAGMGDIINAHINAADNPTRPPVVPAPYADLSRLLAGGWHAGQLVVIGARPATGKSVVALDAARHAAEHGTRALVVSLEMTHADLAARFLAAAAAVQLDRTRQIPTDPAVLTEEDWRRISRVTAGFEEWNVQIEVVDPTDLGSAGFTVDTLRRHLTAMRKLGSPAGLVVVDYLQLVRPVNPRSENRQIEVAEISRSLKLLAIEFAVPVVVVAQLNRGPEQRADKRPQVSDLRESGAVEADADVVILLHRPDMYGEERMGEMDLIVGKNRNGPTATVAVASQLHYSRFVDMASSSPPPVRPDLRVVPGVDR